MEVWKIIFLSKWVICRFHVNLPGCKVTELPHGIGMELGNQRLRDCLHHIFGKGPQVTLIGQSCPEVGSAQFLQGFRVFKTLGFQKKDMGVSRNKGTPKWMVYNGKPDPIKMDDLGGKPHYFRKHSYGFMYQESKGR